MAEDIFERLMKAAKQHHEDRLCAEFGPGGGNPDAKLEEGLEYQAAQEIVRLRQLCAEADRCIDCDCDLCSLTKKRLAYAQSYNLWGLPEKHGRIVI